jgi:excisionase family DNA binding protein
MTGQSCPPLIQLSGLNWTNSRRCCPALPQTPLVTPDGSLAHLPPAVYQVLSQVITAMRAGRAITVAPLAQRLTTQEAADLLGISRPTMVKLLDDGKLPFEQPGRHRRIRLDDLLAYRDERRRERSKALDELVRQTDALGLYDEEAPEAR